MRDSSARELAHPGDHTPAAPDRLPPRPILAFADPGYELDFVRYYNNFYYRYAQVSLSVGLFLILADFVADYLFAPSQAANFYRLQLCLPILGLGIACSFTPFARRHWQPIMAGFIAVVAFSLFGVLLAIDHEGGMGLKSWVGILNFIFLEFYCFVILGVRFNFALVSGALILLAFELALYGELATDRSAFLYLTYQVVTASLKQRSNAAPTSCSPTRTPRSSPSPPWWKPATTKPATTSVAPSTTSAPWRTTCKPTHPSPTT